VRPQEQPVEPPHPPPHKPAAPANEETLTLAPGVPMTFVRVPAGPFLMGSTDAQVQESIKRGIREDWVKRQSPQHTVELSEYWIAKTPVTVAQFEAFIKAEKYRTTAEQKGSGRDWTGSQWEEIKGADWRRPRGPESDVRQKANHPVTQVSWDDAVAFCEWASKVTGRQIRLPSEAEWEKAARGEKGWLYPWGDQAPDEQRCNFNRNVEDTTPVGQYSPQGDSPYGCADMAGNVWEWCSDWYSESTYSRRSKGPVRDPIGPPKGDDRVLRGGSWLNVEVNVRCAYRDRSGPSNRGSDAGFRPARSP
jgi:formylglycine-generating enzyme required for sulfatase activity